MRVYEKRVESGKSRAKKYSSLFTKFLNHFSIQYLSSVFIVAGIGLLLFYWKAYISYHSVSLIFLFILSLLPLLNFRPGPIFFAAFASALIWNYYFIPPAFTLMIGSIEDTLMFVMYFVIATVSSFLISRIRLQQLFLDQKEKRISALYNLTKDLSAARSLDDVIECSVRRLNESFHSEAVFIFMEDEKTLKRNSHYLSSFEIDQGEWNYAQMVFLSCKKIGRFTESAASITALTYLPIYTKERKLGVAGLLFPEDAAYDKTTDSLLDSFLAQISTAVEREYLKELNKKNLVIAESEKLYKTLFDSVSHELKTPITTLLGAVSSFKDEKIIQNRNVLFRLIDEASIATERLQRLVENLLDITRLESGVLKLKKNWHSVADLINSAVTKIKSEASVRKIKCKIPEEIGLCFFDYPLIEQALINVIHNSLEYTPSDGVTDIIAERNKQEIIISVGDTGPGFPDEELQNIFKKFYRIPGTKSGGLGLGLSIAKGFIEAHGGTIEANNKTTGGALFSIKLPAEEII